MSDADDFDKEAEREKLREQFERDREKREASERMSELLLKGATMTNKHCPECGDPVFRHEGREFCPTCRRPVAEDGDHQHGEGAATDTGTDAAADDPGAAGGGQNRARADDAAGPPTEDAADAPAGDAADTPADAAASADATGGTRAPPSQSGDPAGRGRAPDARRSDPAGAGAPGRSGATGRSPPGDAGSSAAGGGDPAGDAGTGAGDLAAAHAALARTLTDLARRAEAAEDLGRKRDYLAAATEAAEALRAVRQAGK